MLRGSIGSHTCSVEFVKDLKHDDGESLVGQCIHDTQRGHVRIQLDPECQGLGMVDTLLHEALHGAEYVFKFDIEHEQIYTIASSLCQFLVSTGLIDPQAFEGRLRLLMANAAEKP